MGVFKEIDIQIQEMGNLTLPYLQQYNDFVWFFIYRSPTTNAVKFKYFTASCEEDAWKKMNQYLVKIIINGG